MIAAGYVLYYPAAGSCKWPSGERNRLSVLAAGQSANNCRRRPHRMLPLAGHSQANAASDFGGHVGWQLENIQPTLARDWIAAEVDCTTEDQTLRASRKDVQRRAVV